MTTMMPRPSQAGDLLAMAFFRRPSLRSIVRKAVKRQLQPVRAKRQSQPARDASRNTVLNQHFEYQEDIASYYRQRDKNPGSLQSAIDACGKQIAMGPQARQAFLREYPRDELPSHKGFTQLAVILEKRGGYEEGIRLCRQAMEQGWSDNWEGRIERMEKKMAKRKP